MAGPAPGRPTKRNGESGIPEEERSGWKRLETLPGDCRADDGKDAGADDCADSQGRQAQPSRDFLAGTQHFPNPRSVVDTLHGRDMIPPCAPIASGQTGSLK